MTNRNFPEEADNKPLDPAVERVRRKLMRFVAINLGLLFVALMAVVLAIVYRARTSDTADAPAAPPASVVENGTIPLPAGSRIVSQSLSGSRLSIDAEAADGKRTIYIFDLGQNRVVGRFAVTAE